MGEMAAGFAHEVNQPLTAIANYASVSRRLLDKGIPDPTKLSDTLEKMQAQAIRASEVVEHLRQFVRAPKGARSVHSLSLLINEVLSLAEVDSIDNGVPIVFSPKVVFRVVYVDDVQIQYLALILFRFAMEDVKAF